MNVKANEFFVKNILLYYKHNKRELPWRDTKDPYKIWLSEIILQQTQVKQALSYYLQFIQKFPTVQHLANATEDEVLHLWQGLGYYSRARNLHYAAKQIIKEFNGQFPATYQDILKLKGIGHYTAAAIASIAYNLPYAVLDGNVYRVLSRYFGIETPIDTTEGKKYFQNLAQELLDRQNPSEYNQGIMEFGATYCKPANPDCLHCVLNKYCIAFHQKKVEKLPVKSKIILKKNRYFNYFIFIEDKKYTYIQKRNNADIWRGLYQFYLVESKNKLLSLKEIKNFLAEKLISFQSIDISNTYKHILTHQTLFIQFINVYISKSKLKLDIKKIPLHQLHQYPFPIVIKNFIREKTFNGV